SRGSEIVNCEVHGNGIPFAENAHGIFVRGSANVIKGCRIHHSQAAGIHLFWVPGIPVDDNRCFGNAVYQHGNNIDAHAVTLATGTGNPFYNNLVYANAAAIEVLGASATQIYHNTIVGHLMFPHSAIDIYPGSSDTAAQNNIFFGNYQDWTVDSGTGSR